MPYLVLDPLRITLSNPYNHYAHFTDEKMGPEGFRDSSEVPEWNMLCQAPYTPSLSKWPLQPCESGARAPVLTCVHSGKPKYREIR